MYQYLSGKIGIFPTDVPAAKQRAADRLGRKVRRSLAAIDFQILLRSDRIERHSLEFVNVQFDDDRLLSSRLVFFFERSLDGSKQKKNNFLISFGQIFTNQKLRRCWMKKVKTRKCKTRVKIGKSAYDIFPIRLKFHIVFIIIHLTKQTRQPLDRRRITLFKIWRNE